MAEWFAEKSLQVEPAAVNAFGIEIFSRYGNCGELIEMMRFAEGCAKRGVEHYVRKVFNDSKACMCSIDLAPVVQGDNPIATSICEAADEALSQFLWFDNHRTEMWRSN